MGSLDCKSSSDLWFNSPDHANHIALDRGNKDVILSAGDSEIVIIDVSDPYAPRLKSSFGEPQNGAGTWGVTVSRNTAYLSYVRTPILGLRY